MAPRAYSSPIRDAQVEQTRQRLLDTTHAILTHDGLDALTLPRLAQAATVSVPTVYRHFPTIDDLLRAYLEWLRPRLGQTADRLLNATPEELPALPLGNYAAYEEHAHALLAVMESPTFNRIRVGSMKDRARRGADVLRESAPGWSQDELEAAAGAIYVLGGPQAWRWLRETWGIDGHRAARAASWAMRVLIDALGKHRGLERPYEAVAWTRRGTTSTAQHKARGDTTNTARDKARGDTTSTARDKARGDTTNTRARRARAKKET